VTEPSATALAAVETFEFEGARLSYEVFGSGPRSFVFLHGLLMDSQMNRELARSLAGQGHRVVLLDLLGHGASDKPAHASAYRMDVYGRQVVALLDHLGIDDAVIGGTSLGANVSLQVAVQAPERVRGLVFEMPVLEWAVPAAALLFTPLLLGVRMLRRPAGAFGRLMARVPRTGNDTLNSILSAASVPPEVVTAVLHGILTGPVCPTIEERRAIDAPALVIAHTRDVIHPFSDAENLADTLPNARLVPARSMLEMRIAPERLTGEIADFLDELERSQAPAADGRKAAGSRKAPGARKTPARRKAAGVRKTPTKRTAPAKRKAPGGAAGRGGRAGQEKGQSATDSRGA
jgi:pimeloyl-ACP methyl ester carboxylesterase